MTAPGPDYARSVAMAREARGRGAPVGAERRQRRPARAVLGLALAGIAAISLGGRHAGVGGASLGAAADDPTARTEEVDVMRMRSVAAVSVVMVATGAVAGEKGGGVPPGWTVVADAYSQFSNTQGDHGWTYLYDEGAGTAVLPMPFNPVWEDGSITKASWGIAPRVGCSGSDVSVCLIASRPVDDGRVQMHTQRASGCCGPSVLRRPVVRWSAPSDGPLRVRFTPHFSWIGHGSTFDVLFDGSVVLSGTEADQGHVFELDTLSTTVVEIRENPGSNCAALLFELMIFAPTCPGDVIQNGIVDGADLSALLSVWGTAGGIYPRADANGDGVVNGSDLSIVLSGWGACPQ